MLHVFSACYIRCITFFVKFHENISKGLLVTEQVQINYRIVYFKIQKGHKSKTKVGKHELQVLHSAHSLMVLYISVKVHENILNGLSYRADTITIFKLP